MNTELITFCNIMTAAEAVPSTPAKPAAHNKTSHTPNNSQDEPLKTDTSKTTKTDNSYHHIHEEAVNKHSHTETSQTANASQNIKNSSKSVIHTKSPGAHVQDVPVQNYFAEGPVIVTVPKIPKTAGNNKIKQQASNPSPHSTVTIKGRKFPPAYLQNLKQVVTETGKQVKIDTSKIQKIDNLSTGQIKSKSQDETPKTTKTLINNSTQNTAVITDKTNGLKKESFDTKIPIQTKDEPKSPEPAMTADAKTAIDTNKQTIKKATGIKDTREAAIPKSNKQIAQAQIDSVNKVNPTVENKKDLPTAYKQENTKTSDTQAKTVKIQTDKPTKTTEKPAEEKTIHPGNFSETSKKNNNTIRHDSNDSETNPNTKTLKTEDVQVTSEQVKNAVNSVSNKSLDSESSHTHTQNTQPITEQANNTTSTTKTIDQLVRTNQNDSQPDVGKQIFESIRSSGYRPIGEQQITVRLNPPELGRVFIRFQEQDNQITGILEVSKSQTRLEIEQALPQIVRNLTDSGVQVRRLEVVLNNEQSGHDSLNKDQLFQNGDSQNQKHPNSDSWQSGPNRNEINEFFINNPVYQNNSKLQQVSVNGSLNMLI